MKHADWFEREDDKVMGWSESMTRADIYDWTKVAWNECVKRCAEAACKVCKDKCCDRDICPCAVVKDYCIENKAIMEVGD